VESLSEFFDIEVEGTLEPAAFLGRINRLLPKGIEVKSCDRLKPGAPSVSASISGAVWNVELPHAYPGGRERLGERIRWLSGQRELFVERTRSEGIRKVNISPFIASVEAVTDRSLTMVTRFLPGGSTRPQEVLQYLLEDPEEMLASARVLKVDSLLNTNAQ
jgi:radical SAM-linked protein